MRVTEVSVRLVKLDEPARRREMFIIPGQDRMQFDRRTEPTTDADQLALIEIHTDNGIRGICTAISIRS